MESSGSKRRPSSANSGLVVLIKILSEPKESMFSSEQTLNKVNFSSL